MQQENLKEFIKELTNLCDKYHLWVEGESVRIEDDNGNLVGSFLTYNDQSEIYTAKLVGQQTNDYQ